MTNKKGTTSLVFNTSHTYYKNKEPKVYKQRNPQIHVYTNEIENVFLINNDNFW